MARVIQSPKRVRSVAVIARFAGSATPLRNASGIPLLAHQGGWDEVALVAGPIVVIAGLLLLAKRRVDAIAEDSGRSRSDQGQI
jgi:hypothetical protein